MTDIVKYLPEAAVPAGGAPAWSVADAERWRKARTPAFLAPVAGGWALAPLVLVAVVLLGWNEPEVVPRGTSWDGYPAAVLLLTLPLWFRFLPAAVLFSVPVIVLEAVLALTGLDAADTAGRAGNGLVLALSAGAFTGALLRLRARRRQRELALAAAGKTRGPLPEKLPEAHRRRGLRLILAGAALCLAAAGLLVWGLVQDLRANHGPTPYDAMGQQVVAMLLLVPGTTLLGRGIAARRAARRLHTGPQPVLRVGIRGRDSLHWLYADARTPSAPPLIAYRDRYEDTAYRGRTLLGGPEERLRTEHHDINQYSEPFEAILYGVPCEGAEVVLEFAVFSGSGGTLESNVTAAPLLPARCGRLRAWSPAGTSYRVRCREEEARRSDGSSGSSGCGSSSSCSSCGGGCGGGD
ncbi:hypothetical protein [Streptomyces sp. SYSU K21746]